MSSITINSTITLRGGAKMPRLGFGLYQSTNALKSTLTAYENGYVHFDCARIYRNENELLEGTEKWLKEAKDAQSDSLWLTTKVTSKEHGPDKKTGADKTILAVDDSNAKAESRGLKWDLFLLHDPTAGPEKRLQAWKVLCDKRKKGELASIGVSNFSEKHLQQLVDAGCEVPEVNQIELHPWLQQKPIVEWCRNNGVVVQAYCPIVRGQRMSDPTLQKVAEKVQRTPAQVLIRWSLQKGYVPLPKSDTPSRIKENVGVFDFELAEEEMATLDSLDDAANGSCSWNPVAVL